jgi:hypothetical protein
MTNLKADIINKNDFEFKSIKGINAFAFGQKYERKWSFNEKQMITLITPEKRRI